MSLIYASRLSFLTIGDEPIINQAISAPAEMMMNFEFSSSFSPPARCEGKHHICRHTIIGGSVCQFLATRLTLYFKDLLPITAPQSHTGCVIESPTTRAHMMARLNDQARATSWM